MKIGVVGSRRRNLDEDYEKVREQIGNCALAFKEDVQLVSGGCSSGADRFAEEIAKSLHYDIIIHYPQYYTHGRTATFIRNDLIAKESDILIACVAEDRKGGTEDTIKKFKKYHPNGKLIIV